MILYPTKKVLYSERNYQQKGYIYLWEKVFTNNVFDKGSLSKIHKELLQLSTKKQSN